ncbi:MAG: hypothetical protein J2P58_14155 [Acidimicrobiaceae bacterium]|nr:hypothetical protein [Acidimicrobiaceae bacterium]
MDKLTLFGVVGFERGRGVSGGLAVVEQAGRRRTVFTSRSIAFHDAGGHAITVTSRPSADDERFDSIREWAPMNTYLATPEGRDKLQSSRETGQRLEPANVEWQSASIRVEGRQIEFQVCRFDHHWWAAVGRLPDAVITLDSRGVPFEKVALERVPEHSVPALPDLGEPGQGVAEDLHARFQRLPFHRVGSMSDYWALRSVEVDHVQNLARRYAIPDRDREAIQDHWLARIDAELSDTLEHLRFKQRDAALNSRIGRHLRAGNALYRLWSNTLGPGARTWFGNRYGPIRRHTFRLRWRP